MVLLSTAAFAEGPPPLRINTSLYPILNRVDNDADLTFTINAILPHRFTYFSFVNFSGVLSDEDSEFVRSKNDLKWSPHESWPVYLNFQAVFVKGSGNDYQQLGVGLRVHDTPGLDKFFDSINLVYNLTFQLKRFGGNDSSAWQMAHFFRLTFPDLSDRIYISGFLDQTFDSNLPAQFSSSPYVTEIQGGIRIWKKFYFVTEYRKNEFRIGNEHNLAVGLEFQKAFQ